MAVADTLEPTSAHKLLPLNHDYINMPQPLLLDDVQNFALQIASGLEHLKEMKVWRSILFLVMFHLVCFFLGYSL